MEAQCVSEHTQGKTSTGKKKTEKGIEVSPSGQDCHGPCYPTNGKQAVNFLPTISTGHWDCSCSSSTAQILQNSWSLSSQVTVFPNHNYSQFVKTPVKLGSKLQNGLMIQNNCVISVQIL